LRSRVAQVVFLLFLLSSLLFLVALYTDVRLSIELAGLDTMPQSLLDKVSMVRTLGTVCATVVLFMFVLATGLLGWMASSTVGILSSLIAVAALSALWFVWLNINAISSAVSKLS